MKGRGRLPNLKLLPEECSPIIAWANDELRKDDRTQTDIYEEFYAKLEALQREHRGELVFTIPSFQAFNRHSIKLAAISQRIDQTREISSVLAEKFDAKSSDDLTIIAAEAIKTLIFELLTSAGESGIDPKGAMNLANALRAAAQAQGVSTIRREKIEADFNTKAAKAIDAVATVKGLTAKTVEDIKAQILGIAA